MIPYTTFDQSHDADIRTKLVPFPLLNFMLRFCLLPSFCGHRQNSQDWRLLTLVTYAHQWRKLPISWQVQPWHDTEFKWHARMLQIIGNYSSQTSWPLLKLSSHTFHYPYSIQIPISNSKNYSTVTSYLKSSSHAFFSCTTFIQVRFKNFFTLCRL